MESFARMPPVSSCPNKSRRDVARGQLRTPSVRSCPLSSRRPSRLLLRQPKSTRCALPAVSTPSADKLPAVPWLWHPPRIDAAHPAIPHWRCTGHIATDYQAVGLIHESNHGRGLNNLMFPRCVQVLFFCEGHEGTLQEGSGFCRPDVEKTLRPWRHRPRHCGTPANNMPSVVA